MYDHLLYSHRQHHAIVQALENGESSRVAALMVEHAHGAKVSINLSRAGLRSVGQTTETSALNC
jgi:GntR family transcriptional regulator of vanillate catabolism